MDRTFPRLSLAGEVASGHSQVVCREQVILSPGFTPQWIDDQTIAAIGPKDWLYAVKADGTWMRPQHEQALSLFAAGAGKVRVAIPGEVWLAIDPITGAEGVIVEHGGNNNDRSLFINGRPIVLHQTISDVRLFDGMAVWRSHTGRTAADSGIRGVRDVTKPQVVDDLRVVADDWEGAPVPIRVGDQPWVLFQTNVDLRIRPWNSTQGYILATGEDMNFNPDALGMGGFIRVVWNDKHGNLGHRDLRVTEPRVDVSVPLSPPVIVIPDPMPDPEPEPEPMAVPDEEEFVRETAEAHIDLLERMQKSSHATDALRKQLGEDHPDVRAGEVATDNLKGEMCRVIVWGLFQQNANWGLLRKASGAGAVRSDGVRHATDVAFWKPDGKVVDILTDYGPTWANRDGDFQPKDLWVKPQPEPRPGTVVVVPDEDEPDDSVPTGDVLAELHRLATSNAALEVRIAKVETRTTVLEQRPSGAGVTGKLVITGITLDVDGSS